MQEKKRAEEMYEKAVKEKKTAVLLTETRPDIFQLKLGSLSPGSECLVTITFVLELPVEETKTRLTIPTTIAPKYISQRQHQSSVVPQALKNILYKEDTPAPLSLDVRVLMKTRIRSVVSPSHDIQAEMKEEEGGEFEAGVKFAGDTAALDRDIVLLIQCEEPNRPKILLEKGSDGTVAALLTFVPSFEMKKQQSECIFLIDCSGSMGGESIKLAREALSVFVNSVPADYHFNIYCFGSRYNKLFPASQPLTDQTLQTARSLLDNLDANLGGTEIFPPLQDIFQQPLLVGKPRQVFVITDGQVSNTRETISLVRKHASTNRVFSLGIGSSSDRHLVKGLARSGRGTAQFVSEGENIASKVVRQLKLGIQPCLHDVKIDWGDREGEGEGGVQFCQAPHITPPLYDGTRLILYKLWEQQTKLADKVKISAKTPEGELMEELEISEESYSQGDLVHKMFARKMIQDLEERHGGDGEEREEVKAVITDLALRYNLSSQYTAFIGVNEAATTGQEEEDFRPVSGLVSRQVHNMYDRDGMMPRGSFFSMDFMMCDTTLGAESSIFESLVSRSKGLTSKSSQFSKSSKSSALKSVFKSATSMLTAGPRRKGVNGSGEVSSSKIKIDKIPTLNTDMDRLLALTSLQTAGGAFRYEKSVMDLVLGAEVEKFRELCEGRNIAQDRWLTAFIIAFIEHRFAAEKDTWELIVEKSRDWLSDDHLVEEARKIIN